MADKNDFAFASGGILWRVLDRSKFESRSLRFKLLALIGIALSCWLPLAILTLLKVGWDSFYLFFVRDIATHVRFLFVLPVLIFARHSFNMSFNRMLDYFHATKIIDADNKDAFEKILSQVVRWRNSRLVDFVMIFLAYSSFFLQERNVVNSSVSYAPWHLIDGHITSAGWWYLIFSLPILQLLLFRWLYTIILWIYFLGKISKVNLHLSALHPDGMGGLGFLKYTQISFFPVALAIAALVAGVINNSMIFSGTSILEYKVLIISVLVFVLLLFTLPLLTFIPLLSRIKREYFLKYSLDSWPIARQYEKELDEFQKTGEEKPDASWHVDLIGSFEKVSNMKIILIDKSTLFAFVTAVIIPFLPVIAQQLPLKELVFNLVGKILG